MIAVLGKERGGVIVEIDYLIDEAVGCSTDKVEGLEHIQALVRSVEKKFSFKEETGPNIDKFVVELCNGIKELAYKGLIRYRC